MQVWRGLSEVPQRLARTVVTIGNFDGLHRGHQHIFARCREVADQSGVDLVVAVTFDPHPMAVLRPEHAPDMLTSVAERLSLFESIEVDAALVLPFDLALAAWSPAEFGERVLATALHASTVVVGANFRFGHRAAGDVETLRELGARHDFAVEPIGLEGGSEVWSSTYVRHRVAAGDVEGAREVLGRPFAIRGVVTSGDRRGRELGFPTANLPIPDGMVVPAEGVYAGWLRVLPSGPRMPAAISVGTNPTFAGDRAIRVEAHVIDGSSPELYDLAVEVELVARLRPMERFESVDALVSAMRADVRRSRYLLGG
ncbi:MAG: bifunctional riboflavin kinase/FAD synthetase [Nocardioides sp.]